MITTNVIKDCIVDDRLFGHNVKSLSIEGVKYYIVPSIFRHFGFMPSTPFKDNYCRRIPNCREYLITYSNLYDYCRAAMSQNRIKNKPRLMELINRNENASMENTAKVGEGIIAIPDTATVEAQQLKLLIDKLGISRITKIIEEMGLLPKLTTTSNTSENKTTKTIKITIEY